jgi:hypothetical protein
VDPIHFSSEFSSMPPHLCTLYTFHQESLSKLLCFQHVLKHCHLCADIMASLCVYKVNSQKYNCWLKVSKNAYILNFTSVKFPFKNFYLHQKHLKTTSPTSPALYIYIQLYIYITVLFIKPKTKNCSITLVCACE